MPKNFAFVPLIDTSYLRTTPIFHIDHCILLHPWTLHDWNIWRYLAQAYIHRTLNNAYVLLMLKVQSIVTFTFSLIVHQYITVKMNIDSSSWILITWFIRSFNTTGHMSVLMNILELVMSISCKKSQLWNFTLPNLELTTSWS